MYMSDYQIPVRRVGTAIVISGNRQERKFEQTVIDRALPIAKDEFGSVPVQSQRGASGGPV